ncbi:hypothetical protein SAZ11_52680 [Streptomyces sp. FXJ1.4098]|nr:hypothetical protein [Streptomyces sp. FXJ1.4098]
MEWDLTPIGSMTRLVVRVVRGGKRLLNTRYHLEQAQLTEEQWRTRWQAGRRFLAADGEGSSRTPADGRSSAELGVQGLAERPSGSVPLWLGSAAALAGNYRARAEEYARMSSPARHTTCRGSWTR